MGGGHAQPQPLFYARSNSNRYHLFYPDQDTSICGYLDIPRTGDGQLDKQTLHVFETLDAKPAYKWCFHCRRTLQQRRDP